MRVSTGWLAEWISLPAVELLADRLTAGGLEVDAIERSGPDLSSLRVGSVRACRPHPNAERLTVCEVAFDSDECFEIVCGAPNVDAGQKVAVALPGTTLPDGTRIKKSKIRGVTSMGMICSAQELGIGREHDGILVLDPDAPVGAPLDRVLAAGESVFEITITPNRGDCASMLGIAREVQAHFGGEIRLPECSPRECLPPAGETLQIGIDDPSDCHHYVGRVVRGLTVGESPAWLRSRLEAAGLRPINNVVDATNLVMLEFGQPLHAFDLAKLAGGRLRVRTARPGEELDTLDGQSRQLEAGDLVIADGEKAIALAGVMGGANSEVGATTRDLLIESAHFPGPRVRRAARRLGLSTEASYRFERGIDPEGVGRAADRAARLIADLSGGEVAAGRIETRGAAVEKAAEISLDPEHVNRLLGTDLRALEVRRLLERVGLVCHEQTDGRLRCSVPSHRNDLSLPEDLIEEVARIHGYDKIPASLQHGPLLEAAIPRSWIQSDVVRDSLRAEGLTEVASFPFMDLRDLDRLRLGAEDARRETLSVLNPMVESDSQLRSSLLPSLLRITRENLNRQLDQVGLFEVARVFRVAKRGELPEEPLFTTAILTRGEERGLWDSSDRPPLFFEAKGAVEHLLAALRLSAELRVGSPQPYHHPGASCSIAVGRRVVGEVGELHPEVAAEFGIELPCALIELDLSAVGGIAAAPPRYREVSRHPLVRRDLAVLVDPGQPADEILKAIRQRAGAHLISVRIFDRYEGAVEGKVSLAFRLVFQHPERTLTDAEITKAVDRVVRMLGQRFGGELR